MTEQLYCRRAGDPVKVWRVGDGESPEWIGYLERLPAGRRPEWCFAFNIASGVQYARTGDMIVQGDGSMTDARGIRCALRTPARPGSRCAGGAGDR